MEPKFQTSFIPKEAIVEHVTGRKSRGTLDLMVIVALILFLGSIAASVGVFLYSKVLEQSIASKQASLERAKQEFEPALIEQLTRLDARINAAQAVLKNHVATSEVFRLLSSYTIQSVRFENFNYQNDSSGKISLTMKGRAKSFGALAFQSDVFAKVPFLKDEIFSNPNLDQAGNVTFDFSATVDPSLISYAQKLQATGAGTTQTETTNATTTNTVGQ